MELKKWKRGNLKKSNYKLYAIRVNVIKEKDLFKALESVENASGYIKALIRKDITP